MKEQPIKDHKHMASILKQAFEKSGKTHYEVCKKAGLSQGGYLNKILNGTYQGGIDKYIEIGKVLGVELKVKEKK